MMLFCCCSKSRANDDLKGGAGRVSPPESLYTPGNTSLLAGSSKAIGRILIAFLNEEQKLGLKDI